VNLDEDNYLLHYGILRRSGRYPWGSGGPETASSRSFLDYVESLRKSGMSDTDIARGFGVSTTQLRAAKSIAVNEERQSKIGMAQRLKDKGYSNVAIGERMGIPESSVRSLLAPGAKDRADVLQATANMLKDQVEKKKYIDVGSGVENSIGVSSTKLKTAVAMLQEEGGYKIHYLKEKQIGTGKYTTVMVLTKDDVPYAEVSKNRAQVQQINTHSPDGGHTYLGIKPPLSISSKRVGVRYAEQGGASADGVIYVRPGVKDVSLGASRYAQVRIAVDGTHYLKGMAVYRNDLPDGVDLVFNTNKHDTGNKLDAMKELKKDQDGNIDPDNPFGASIKPGGQILERGHDGVDRPTSVMNKLNEEGDWESWRKVISSQVLSKQSPALAKNQLEMRYEKKRGEFEEIRALTNPAVRRKLLETFAEDADSSAVHLEAHHLPRQASHVILPINSLKDHEIYAPNYRDGEKVVLIRYPHGGTFEIPELTVNNKNREAKDTFENVPGGHEGRIRDAVGINSKVAERLSGADFDGDTVLVIPNNTGAVKTTSALEGLKNFDPKAAFPGYEGMPKMTATQKQRQMGDITNLIADMTIKRANTTELARAVRHSMVVIDAEKHDLNYKESARANGIAQLKEKYQGRANAGASTLITRATSEQRVAKRVARRVSEGGPVDPTTGEKRFTPTGETHVDKKGNTVLSTFKSTKLAETTDAHTLSSGSVIEKVYADHSNRLKALANDARKELINTHSIPYSPSAREAYKTQVATLNAKLNTALKNSPRERQAQLLANATVTMKKQANPNMTAEEEKKIKFQALAAARVRTGAGKERIEITQDEWNAIQSGAISNNMLTKILNNSDIDTVKKLATPKTQILMTSTKISRARQMMKSGYTQADIADALGVSMSTLKSSIGGE
jgi:DNA-binding transcriptional regulator YiaG